MTSMAISVFKAHALETIGRVSKSKERIVITKRGKPIAQVVPYQLQSATLTPGRLSQTLVFEKDLVTPLGKAMWEASR
ncbi:MAG: type II toxin-antitoxin system prevent-host-death family antitoxin [Lentisphaerota bacterium]